MGYWGIKSYENDEAHDALDAGFEAVHGDAYDDLMDDRNPLTPEQIQQKLANPETLTNAIEALVAEVDRPWDDWDDEERLGFVGVVVRHAELNVPIPGDWRDRAIAWLEGEEAEWDEATARNLRRRKEIDLLTRSPRAEPEG